MSTWGVIRQIISHCRILIVGPTRTMTVLSLIIMIWALGVGRVHLLCCFLKLCLEHLLWRHLLGQVSQVRSWFRWLLRWIGIACHWLILLWVRRGPRMTLWFFSAPKPTRAWNLIFLVTYCCFKWIEVLRHYRMVAWRCLLAGTSWWNWILLGDNMWERLLCHWWIVIIAHRYVLGQELLLISLISRLRKHLCWSQLISQVITLVVAGALRRINIAILQDMVLSIIGLVPHSAEHAFEVIATHRARGGIVIRLSFMLLSINTVVIEVAQLLLHRLVFFRWRKLIIV